MESGKIFPPLAIKKIANVMATQNPADANYLKGPELVSMFNALGYPDAYTFQKVVVFKQLIMGKDYRV